MQSEHQVRVDDFMRLANQELPEKATVPSSEIRKLRAKLILEEAFETVVALGFSVQAWATKGAGASITFTELYEPDLVEVADGCADIKVVTTGTLSACGIDDVELQEAVDENNLAKFKDICPDCSYDQTHDNRNMVMMRTGEEFKTEPGQTICYECGFQYRSGYRRDDGKWVKPAGHKPPDIRSLLLGQGWEPNE